MTNKGWLEVAMAVVPSRWSYEGLLAAERMEREAAWKIRACVTSGAGIVDSKFNCAVQELRDVTSGAGGLGFTSYDEPLVAFTVLALISLIIVFTLPRVRRDVPASGAPRIWSCR